MGVTPAESTEITGQEQANSARFESGMAGIDLRTRWGRRYRQLVETYAADIGEPTAMQASMIGRAASLTVELERSEASFASADKSDTDTLAAYRTTSEALRRVLESLGMRQDGKASPKTISATPPKMIRWGEFAERNGIEDVEPDGAYTSSIFDRSRYELPRRCAWIMTEAARADARGEAISENAAEVFRLLGFTPQSFRDAYNSRHPNTRWGNEDA